MAVADTTAGDCHTNVCDGMGAVTSIVNDADVPATSSECVVTSLHGWRTVDGRPSARILVQPEWRTHL